MPENLPHCTAAQYDLRERVSVYGTSDELQLLRPDLRAALDPSAPASSLPDNCSFLFQKGQEAQPQHMSTSQVMQEKLEER